jgi:hypothetical protein
VVKRKKDLTERKVELSGGGLNAAYIVAGVAAYSITAIDRCFLSYSDS